MKLSRDLLNLLSRQTRSLVRGTAFNVVTRGMMAEINAAHTKTRGGEAKSSGDQK